MHLLHRSNVFGGGGGGGRAPPPRRVLSKSDSVKKRSAANKGSKRARLRAGLAAALQELGLAGRQKRGAVCAAADATTRPVAEPGVHPCCNADAAAAAAPVAREAAGRGEPASSSKGGTATGGALQPLLMLLLALACVVALGRAPAVCCCTCAAWLCRGDSASAGRPRSSSGVARPQAGAGIITSGEAMQRR